MMNKKNKKLITGFLSDTLTKEEKARFLKEVSTNKALMKELVKELEIDDVIEEEFGSAVEEDDDEDPDKSK